ncbi:DMT family transporter [Rheinheimera sp.]|uniref:DMT family transporter n=1 Tax=Rheinheimera sp. TaxID=1869214 RepID=UPI00307DB7AF
MSVQAQPQVVSREKMKGWCYGLAGMLMFSGGIPATRAAVLSLNPVFVGAARALIAAALALALLWLTRQPIPTRQKWKGLTGVLAGAVMGYPLLSALALQQMGANHGTLVSSVMPLFTAVFGAWLTRRWPRLGFWCCALTGTALVTGYALYSGDGRLHLADLYLLLACLLCGYSYAQGAVLAKELGSWQVICWALVMGIPLLLPLVWWYFPQDLSAVSTTGWLGLAYLSIFSMFLGFFAWYKGLALAGIAEVSQLQLLTPFVALFLAAVALHETVSAAQLMLAGAVVGCIALGRRFA